MARQWDHDDLYDPGSYDPPEDNSPSYGTSPNNPLDFPPQPPDPHSAHNYADPHPVDNYADPHPVDNYQLFYSAGEGPSGLGLGAQALACLSSHNSPIQSPGPFPTNPSPDVPFQYSQNTSPSLPATGVFPQNFSPQFPGSQVTNNLPYLNHPIQEQQPFDIPPRSPYFHQHSRSPRPPVVLNRSGLPFPNISLNPTSQASSNTTTSPAKWPYGPVAKPKPTRPPRETLSSFWLAENSVPGDPRPNQRNGSRTDMHSMNGLAASSINGNNVTSPTFLMDSIPSPVVRVPYPENRYVPAEQGGSRRECGARSVANEKPETNLSLKLLLEAVEKIKEMDFKTDQPVGASGFRNFEGRDNFPSNGNASLFSNYRSPPSYASQALPPAMYGANSNGSPSNQMIRMPEPSFQIPLANDLVNINPRAQDPRGPIRRLSFNEASGLPEPFPVRFNGIPVNLAPVVRSNYSTFRPVNPMANFPSCFETFCRNCAQMKQCTKCTRCHFNYCFECRAPGKHRCLPESSSPAQMEVQLHVGQRISPVMNNGIGPPHGRMPVSPMALGFQAQSPGNNTPQRQSQGNTPQSPSEKCPTHFRYPARFQDRHTFIPCCSVCLLKHIGKQPPISSVTPMNNVFIHEDYYKCIDLLSTLIENIPKLINRLTRINPFQWNDHFIHLLFKENIEVNSLNEGLSLINLLTRTNKCITGINFKFTLFDIRELHVELTQCTELYERLESSVEGPQFIPIVPMSLNPGVGYMSLVTGPAVGGSVQRDEKTCFFIVIRDERDVRQEWQENLVNVDIVKISTASQVRHTITPCKLVVGVATVEFTISEQGDYRASVLVNGKPAKGTPFQIKVKSDDIVYKTLFEARKKLGALQEACNKEKGQLQRPWGISITKSGAYLATDRSMGVIHIIEDLKILRTIGEPGSNRGQLKCPTKAVELVYEDGTSHVVVADKDNKRLQILTWEGRFVKETSSSCGLKFPWDLCVTPENLIVCTDNNSNYLFCFDTNLQLVTTLKLPGSDTNARGICNGYMNHIIVTEFHRSQINIMYAPSKLYRSKYQGRVLWKVLYKNTYVKQKRSKGEKHSERFQGLCMDSAGRILFCDSIQNKVRVMTYFGEEIASFPVDGQPQGIVISPGCDVAVANLTQGVIDLYDVSDDRQ